jgi:large subunit ribosomal protein L25
MKTEKLKAESRDKVGKLATRKLRNEGKLPATLYGHNEPSVSLALAGDQVRAVIRHHSRIVELEGAASGQALLQQVQWDTFGRDVLHIDLLRVVKGELLQVEVEVHGKGVAPGENDGGVVEQVKHTVEIEVNPADLPESLHVSLDKLTVGETITAGDIIDLPESAKLLSDAAEVLFTCNTPVEQPETSEEAAGAAEPELVRDRSSDEDDEANDD